MVSPPPPAPAEASSEPARADDRYHSLFVIGEGGMGRVEVALERGAVGFERVVALKRLLPKAPRDARHVQMFLREARLAALIRHPNVVHAFAFGESDGELFLAMQYVEGEPLSRVLAAAKTRGGVLAPVFVAWVLAEVCDGLHAAHELRDESGRPLRVVHRDVSPHNVMVSYSGSVKVVDFGVARFDSGGQATRTGEVKGKMAYMSPEQALGEELDRRSDLFSIGAMFFECLTGRRMWGEGTDLELMRKIALERPPRLDAALPGAPPALVDLHARLIARDPRDRPESAREVANQLRAFAVAAGGPGSRGVLPATMASLFAEEARNRRARLTDALQEASPSSVVALRDSLESPASIPPASERPRRRLGWVAFAAIAALGLGAATWATRSPSSTAKAPSAERPAMETATIQARPIPSALPTAAIAPETADVAPPLDASLRKPPPPKPSPPFVKPPLLAKPALTNKLPDVDPSPF